MQQKEGWGSSLALFASAWLCVFCLRIFATTLLLFLSELCFSIQSRPFGVRLQSWHHKSLNCI